MSSSPIDQQRNARMLPTGLRPGADTRTLVAGVVAGLNIDAGQVQVVVEASDPVWVAAAPFIYQEGSRVRLRRSLQDGGRIEYCEGPIDDAPMFVTGRVTAVGPGGIHVTALGGEWVLKPFAAGTYDPGDDVWVIRHPSGFGRPEGVLGVAAEAAGGSDPGGGSANPGELVSRQATISPQHSGSWKSSSGRWDSWNPDRYGGVATLWQGNAYGSGPMVGWVGYGDQAVNLHAETIDLMTASVIRADSSVAAGKTAVLQGSPNGTRPGGAPSGGGATAATGPLTPGAGQTIQLPSSTYEAWRTGALKGLITVGGDYAGFYGYTRGDAFVITVQYKVRA